MDRLRIIGTSWRWVGVEALGRFGVGTDERLEHLERLRDALGATELLYLATCNRIELVFARPRTAPAPSAHALRTTAFRALSGRAPVPGEAAETLKVWGGDGALEHLLLVASGLDSAEVGEREIRGQLRDAHAEARELGLAGPVLGWAVDRALTVARRIERRTGLTGGRRSLAGIGLEQVRARLSERPHEETAPVALVGVSAMTERCGERLRADGVECLVVNRGAARGKALASRLGVPWRPLDEWLAAPGACAAVVTATGAREPVLDAASLERLARASSEALGAPPLAVDFGMPPDVDAEAAARLGIRVVDMRAITDIAETRRARRHEETAIAREEIDRALDELCDESAARGVAPVVADLAERYRRTAEQGAGRLFRRELQHLGEAERRAVEEFARGLARRFAHVPVVGLRALAQEHGLGAVETFVAASSDASSDEERARA